MTLDVHFESAARTAAERLHELEGFALRTVKTIQLMHLTCAERRIVEARIKGLLGRQGLPAVVVPACCADPMELTPESQDIPAASRDPRNY